MIVAFSGLDGSGKSTQVSYAVKFLHAHGHDVCHVHIIEWSLTNRIGKLVTKRGQKMALSSGDKMPDRPNQIQVLARRVISLLDLIRFRFFALYQTKIRRRILICDRYFFDIAVHGLYMQYMSDAFERFYRRLAPKSTLTVLLDVSPSVAQERERVHTGEYYQQKRKLYLKFAVKWSALTVPAGSINQTHRTIKEVLKPLLGTEPRAIDGAEARNR